MSKNQSNIIITALVMIIAFGGILWYTGQPSVSTPATAPTTPTPTTISTGIPLSTDPISVDVVSTDYYNPGTSLDVCGRYLVKGAKSNIFVGGKTDVATTGVADFTVSDGDTIKIWAGLDDLSASDGDYNCGVSPGQNGTADWYWDFDEVTISRGATANILLHPRKEVTLASVNVINDKYQVCSTQSTANQTVVANGKYSLEVRIQAGSKGCYGQPIGSIDEDGVATRHSAVLVCQGNSTMFDDVEARYRGSTTKFTSGTKPKEAAIGSENESWSYNIPFDMCDGSLQSFDLYVDMGDTTADLPTGDGTAHDNAIGCKVYDVAGYQDADDGTWKYGTEDEQNNDVGITTDHEFQAFFGK